MSFLPRTNRPTVGWLKATMYFVLLWYLGVHDVQSNWLSKWFSVVIGHDLRFWTASNGQDQEKKTAWKQAWTGRDIMFRVTRWGCCVTVFYEKVSNNHREELLKTFNEYSTRKEQDAFLAGQINPHSIKRRRPRQDPAEVALCNRSFQFYLPTCHRNGSFIMTPVCRQMFMATFAITHHRVSFIQHRLMATGTPPVDTPFS